MVSTSPASSLSVIRRLVESMATMVAVSTMAAPWLTGFWAEAPAKAPAKASAAW